MAMVAGGVLTLDVNANPPIWWPLHFFLYNKPRLFSWLKLAFLFHLSYIFQAASFLMDCFAF